MRPTVLGSVLGLLLAPCFVAIENLKSTTATQPQANAQLSDSLEQLSHTLVSFQAKQGGSENELSKQLAELTRAVAQTHETTQDQLAALSDSVVQLKQVADDSAGEPSRFAELLKKSQEEVSQKANSDIEDAVEKAKAELRKEAAVNSLVAAKTKAMAEGVGTLHYDDDDVASVQTIGDAAARIVALEKEVAALKARCKCGTTSMTSTAPAVGYYPSTVYATQGGQSGGCTGSYSSNQYYYSAPAQYSNGQPAYYQPASTGRRILNFGASASGTCRVVNGMRVCN